MVVTAAIRPIDIFPNLIPSAENKINPMLTAIYINSLYEILCTVLFKIILWLLSKKV